MILSTKLKAEKRSDVAALQQGLNSQHFRCGSADGYYGPRTAWAVNRAQWAYGLARDEVVGDKTRAALAKNGQLSPHFHIEADKLYSHGNGDLMISHDLIAKLERLRAHIGRPINVWSGYRDRAYNATLPGAAANSFHCLGLAADIHVAGLQVGTLGAAAIGAGFTGVGYYPRSGFVHVDIRPGKLATWHL